MSAGYDGNIKLGVSVTADSKSVVTELGALRKQIVDMFSSVDKSLAGGSGSFSNLEKTLTKIATDVGNIAKVINGLPTDKVAKVVDTVKEVGTAAQSSGKAMESAFDFKAETASTEELYQKLKQLREEIEAIKKQKLAEGFTPAQAEHSKDVQSRKNQMSDISKELRNNRGLSDTNDYQPATNFHGDVGDAQVKNLQGALYQANETLQELKGSLSTMSEDDAGFAEKTARVNELTQAVANLNEQLALEQARLSNTTASAEPEEPRTAKVSSQNMGYDLGGTKYIEIYGSQGKKAAEEFIAKYNEILSSQGREAATKFAQSFSASGSNGDSMIAQYKAELADLQTKMKDFDKLKITMSDEEVGKTLNRIEELKVKIAELTRDAKFFTLDVPVDDGLRDNMMAMQELQAKMKQFQQTGTGFGSMEEAQTASARLASLTQSVQEYFRSLDPAQQKLAEFKQALTDMQNIKARAGSVRSMTPDERAQYEAASATVRQYRNDLESLIQVRNALKANIAQFEKTGTGMNAEEYQQAKVLLAQVSQQCDRLTNSANRAKDALAQLGNVDKALTKVRSTIASLAKRVGSLVSQFARLGKTGHKSTADISKGFKKGLTTVIKYAFGVRGMFALFRRLRTTAIESLKAIAAQFPEVNAQFSETKTLLSGLKGSFGTMLQPLLTAVLPVINQIISALTTAINLVAKFFATLSGQGFIYKATAKQQDFAESVKETGGAAEKAVKSLMGFDELNTLQDDSSGGGGADTPEWDYEKEMVDPESAISKFAEMLKEAWQTGDFFDVGYFLGEKLRDGLNKVDEWIKTDGYALAKKLGNSFATLINGFVAVPGLADSIGRTVADAINMAMIGLHQFFTVTDWLNVGKFVAETIMAFFDNINWSLLGQTVGSYIMMFVDSIYGFVTNIDFERIGQYIADSINNIFDVMGQVDETGLNGWQKIGTSITEAITGLLEMVIKFIKEVDWGQVGTAIGEMISSIDFGAIVWDVTKLIANLVAAIAEGIANWASVDPISASIASMLGVAVIGAKVVPAITGAIDVLKKLKDAFSLMDTIDDLGVALDAAFGPASTLAGIGMLVGGAVTAVTNFFAMLKNGFSWANEALMLLGIGIAAVGAIILGAPAAVAAVVAGIVAAVATLVVLIKEHWTEICEWFKESWASFKEGWNEFWTAVGDWFTEKWASLSEWWQSTWASIQTGWNNFWTSVGEFFTEKWNAISTWFTEKWNAVVTWFQTTWTNIQTGWNNFWTAVGEFFTNLWNGLCTWLQDTWNNIVTWFQTTWTNIQTGWNTFWTNVQQTAMNIWNAITTFFANGWNKLKGIFDTALNAIQTAVTVGFSAIQTVATNIWNAITSFLSTILSTIKGIFVTVWNEIKTAVTNVFNNIKTSLTNAMNNLKSNLSSALNNIKSTFLNVWNGIKSSVTNIVNGMSNTIKNVINGVKSAVSGVATTVKNTINTVIRALNGLSFTIPDWVPAMGGKRFGFNIPYLAQGAVLPANKPFMAMVGDQKHGTNIEAPLDTIKQAVAEELSDYIDAMMAGFDAVVSAIDNKDMNVSIGDSAIGRAAERYNRRQQLVRGTT